MIPKVDGTAQRVGPGGTLRAMGDSSSTEMGFYLGIDPSITNTGVVVLDAEGKFVDAADGKRFVGKAKGFDRFRRQADGIVDFVSRVTGNRPVCCGYEGYSFGSVHRTYDLAEYGGILKDALRKIASPVYIVPPTTNKAFAVGNGAAGKEAVRKAALAEGLAEGLSGDIYDAYFLALFAAFANGCRQCSDKGLLRKRIALTLNYGEML